MRRRTAQPQPGRDFGENCPIDRDIHYRRVLAAGALASCGCAAAVPFMAGGPACVEQPASEAAPVVLPGPVVAGAIPVPIVSRCSTRICYCTIDCPNSRQCIETSRTCQPSWKSAYRRQSDTHNSSVNGSGATETTDHAYASARPRPANGVAKQSVSGQSGTASPASSHLSNATSTRTCAGRHIGEHTAADQPADR